MNNMMNLINEIFKDTTKGVKGYFKSRVIIMGIVFFMLCIGFLVINAPMPFLLAFIIAILDIIPLVGAGLVMIPWAFYSYFLGNRELGIGLAVLYVILTISKQFIEPKVLGDQIGIRPLYTFLATIIGSIVFGPFGLILGPIFAVVLNSIIKTKKAYDKTRLK